MITLIMGILAVVAVGVGAMVAASTKKPVVGVAGLLLMFAGVVFNTWSRHRLESETEEKFWQEAVEAGHAEYFISDRKTGETRWQWKTSCGTKEEK